MFFLFLFIIIILLCVIIILNTKIKVEIKDFMLNLEEQNVNFNHKFLLQINILVFNIPIYKMKVDINKIFKEENRYKKLNKFKKSKVNKVMLKIMKKINIEIEELDLKIEVGTLEADSTAYIVAIISTVIAIILSEKMDNKKMQKFSVIPVYKDKMIFKLSLNSIFIIDFTHHIKSKFLKKKGRKRNERTSNRKSYANCHE